MKRFAIFIFLFSVFSFAAFSQSDLQVLAIVKLNKSESITVRQLKNRIASYEKQAGRTLSLDERKKALDALISEKLVNQAALKAGISIPDSQVNQYFLQSMAQVVGRPVTEQELNELIRAQTKMSLDEFMKSQSGMSVAEYKEYLKTQLIAQQYIVSEKRDELQKIAATDDEIRAFYELNKASFVWSDMLKLFIVIVPKEKGIDAKTKATSLLKDYKNKKSTRDQIIVQSKAQNAGFQAGEMIVEKTETSAAQLGVPYNTLLDLFNQAENYTSEIKDNEDNCQFYSVIKKYGAKMLTISDVVRPEQRMTVYEYIRQNLDQQKQMGFLSQSANEISKSLDTTANVDRKKTGSDLDKLLTW